MSEEIDLICGCPAIGCNNENQEIHWRHTKCGTYEKINDEGIVRCLKDNCLKCPIVCIPFKCGAHDDYSKFDAQKAFRILGQLSNIAYMNGLGRNFNRKLRKSLDLLLDKYDL